MIKFVERQFISYYDNIGFAPTGIDPSKINLLSRNRTNLYRKLGLHDSFFKGINALEIGPGSGENALDLLDRGVKKLTLCDFSNSVLQHLNQKASEDSRLALKKLNAESTLNLGTFDLVLIEGVIPLQHKPLEIFKNAIESLGPNGVLITTCADEISLLSEVLRKFMLNLLIETEGFTLNDCVTFLSEDFANLPSMTRDPVHWVHDSIFNPWLGVPFSVADLLENLPSDCIPMRFSPDFHLDTVWYKTHLSQTEICKEYLDSFTSNRGFLIDTRSTCTPKDVASINSLTVCCREIFDLATNKKNSPLQETRMLINEKVIEILSLSDILDDVTLESLKAFSAWLTNSEIDALREFRPFWGRGQVHVSVTRRMAV